MYQIVTGVTSYVGVPSTYLVVIKTNLFGLLSQCIRICVNSKSNPSLYWVWFETVRMCPCALRQQTPKHKSYSFRCRSCSMTSPVWIRIYAAIVLQVHSGSGPTYTTETPSLISTNSDATRWPWSAGKIYTWQQTSTHLFIAFMHILYLYLIGCEAKTILMQWKLCKATTKFCVLSRLVVFGDRTTTISVTLETAINGRGGRAGIYNASFRKIHWKTCDKNLISTSDFLRGQWVNAWGYVLKNSYKLFWLYICPCLGS